MERAGLERRFQDELRLGTERLKKEIGYNPTYFNQMLGNHGPIGAVRRLVHSPGVSDGFTKLWENQRLEMSVEALILLPWYEALFEPKDREAARHRLEQYQFDVDGFVHRRRQTPPEWTAEMHQADE